MGVGLAAPQIGHAKAVFVTVVDGIPEAYITPTCRSVGDERTVLRELCLSAGVMWCDVVRPAAIRLDWTDIDGTAQAQEFDGRPARVLQHELDHLHGILNLDRAEPGTIAFVDGDPKLQQLRPAP